MPGQYLNQPEPILAYGILRLHSFRVHLDRPLTCTLFGLAYYLGSACVSLYAPPPF